MIPAISRNIGKVADYFMPKQGEPVSLKTHAAAVAVFAVAASFDPVLAVQLGATYVAATLGWNAYQSQNPPAQAAIQQYVPVPGQQLVPQYVPVPQDQYEEVLLQDSPVHHDPIAALYANPELTDEERMQIAQSYAQAAEVKEDPIAAIYARNDLTDFEKQQMAALIFNRQ